MNEFLAVFQQRIMNTLDLSCSACACNLTSRPNLAIAELDRAAGCVTFAESGRMGLGDDILQTL